MDGCRGLHGTEPGPGPGPAPALDGSDTEGPGTQAGPKQGMVRQVRREWLVHEDSALAYRLQEKEIEMHYGKNREERKIVRMDLQQAKSLQEEDDLGSAVTIGNYVDTLILQELEDERVAKELQEQIEREEALHNRILEQADKELAKKLQEGESLHMKRKTKRGESFDSFKDLHCTPSSSKKDLASCYEDTLTRATRNMSLDSTITGRTSGKSSPSRNSESVDMEIQVDGLQSPILPESSSLEQQEELRRLQEIKDEELALTMQDEEVTKTSQYYKDQQLAIEAQDRELAKLLQEKERLRAKKSRHKTRADSDKSKSANVSETGSRSEGTESDRNEYSKRTQRRAVPSFSSQGVPRSNSSIDSTGSPNKAITSSRNRPAFSERSQSCDEGSGRQESRLERLPISPISDDLQNIAMVLDPTYNQDLDGIQRKSLDSVVASTSTSQSGLRTRSLPVHADISDDDYELDEHMAPPYMPIQGQKRQTVDKRRKKDNCKQQ